MEKKITKATLKSFIRKNKEKLFINVKSEFDGMTDGLESRHEGFVKAHYDTAVDPKYCLGVSGVWMTHRNYFYPYNDGTFEGIEYMNCCGSAILAVKKAA